LDLKINERGVEQMTDEELIQRIQDLTREEAMEAALALEDLPRESPAEEPELAAEAQVFLAELEAEPFAGVEDVEELARAALIVAGLDSCYRPAIEDILSRVGNKAFIFGGAEIVAAGIVAVALVQAVLTKGKRSEEDRTEISFDERGGTRIVRSHKTVYAAGPKLGGLLSSLLSGRG
jgi:hypothetical protein